jgi:hypothetical protein
MKSIKLAGYTFRFVELDDSMGIKVGADYSYRVEYYTASTVQEPAIATLEEVVEIIDGGTHPSKGYYEDIPSVDCSRSSRVDSCIVTHSRPHTSLAGPKWAHHLSSR